MAVFFRAAPINTDLKTSQYNTPGKLFCTTNLRSAIKWAEILVRSESYVPIMWVISTLTVPDDDPVQVWGDSWFEINHGKMTAGEAVRIPRDLQMDLIQVRVLTDKTYPVEPLAYGIGDKIVQNISELIGRIEPAFIGILNLYDNASDLMSYDNGDTVYDVADKVESYLDKTFIINNIFIEKMLELFGEDVIGKNDDLVNLAVDKILATEKTFKQLASNIRALRPELKHIDQVTDTWKILNGRGEETYSPVINAYSDPNTDAGDKMQDTRIGIAKRLSRIYKLIQDHKSQGFLRDIYRELIVRISSKKQF